MLKSDQNWSTLIKFLSRNCPCPTIVSFWEKVYRDVKFIYKLGMANAYQNWGFRENPFSTAPLRANKQGHTLLIGREKELADLCRRLENPPRIPTLEGGNGVGKTSLVNVAGYKLFKKYLDDSDGDLFIPCRKTFQITTADKVEALIDEVLYEVAQTLLEMASTAEMKSLDLTGKTAVQKWLNSPLLSTIQGGLQLFQVGIQGGRNVSQNTGSGFDKSGFRKIVVQWLREIFPEGKGGIICTMDNIELLQESAEARKAVEALRDELLMIPGLRWVLCGANGIVQSVLSSPRLQGVLYTPIDLRGIDDHLIQQVLDSRMDAFRIQGSSTYLPVTVAALDVLYEAVNKNLRNFLSFADEYCLWVADQGIRPESEEEKDTLFFRWFDDVARRAYEAVGTQMRPKAWEVFDRAAELGGQFSPSDFADFGFESLPAMRPHVKILESAGMLMSVLDDSDKRRKSINITSNGYLVKYHRLKQGLR